VTRRRPVEGTIPVGARARRRVARPATTSRRRARSVRAVPEALIPRQRGRGRGRGTIRRRRRRRFRRDRGRRWWWGRLLAGPGGRQQVAGSADHPGGSADRIHRRIRGGRRRWRGRRRRPDPARRLPVRHHARLLLRGELRAQRRARGNASALPGIGGGDDDIHGPAGPPGRPAGTCLRTPTPQYARPLMHPIRRGAGQLPPPCRGGSEHAALQRPGPRPPAGPWALPADGDRARCCRQSFPSHPQGIPDRPPLR
jgi:hypothetical protein